MTIGSRTTATMLFSAFDGDPVDRFGDFKRAPKGFRRIGSGCYRVAYLEKSTKTVYKLGENWCNVEEATNSRRLINKSQRGLGFEVVIPRTRTFRMKDTPSPYGSRQSVIAQQFAENAKPTYCPAMDSWMRDIPDCTCKKRGLDVCLDIIHERIKDWSSVGDIHGENVLMDKDKRFWFIDLAG